MEEKVPSFFRFEDLRVYSKSVEYSKWVLSTLHTANTEGEKTLCRSFFNSSMDIAINIVEGSSRGKSQFEHYLKISKTALRECVIYSSVACGMGLLTEEECERSREYLMELTRMIGALIVSLQKGSRRTRETEFGSTVQDDLDDLGTIDTDIDTDGGVEV